MGKYIEQYDIFSEIKSSNISFVSGNGATLIDDKGQEYIDLNEMTTFLGQNDTYFNDSIKKAMGGLTNSKGDRLPYKEKLIEYIIETTDKKFDKILFTTSGSEAVEWAIRIAKKMTGKNEVISFWNSIHGRTYLSSSLSGLSYRKTGYGNLCQGIVYGVYPNCTNCEFNCKKENCNFYCLDFLDRKITNESSQDIAALIIEPYLGSKIIFPPKEYLKALRKWTKERNILMIVDEIQSGLGRTGSLYSYKDEDIEPDMLLLGKGLGNGFHINALLMKGKLKKSDLTAINGGSGDYELSCAAACSVYDELLNSNLLNNVNSVSKLLIGGLNNMSNQFNCIKEVRGKGFAVAIEFRDEFTKKVITEELKKEKFLFGGNNVTIFLKPPLTFTNDQCNKFLNALKHTLVINNKK